MANLYEVVTQAINDILAHGYDSQRRVDGWLERIRLAISGSLIPAEAIDANVRKTLSAMFEHATRPDKLLRVHQGIGRYTLQMIAPKLRDKLDQRILATTQLIRLNRDEAIPQALRRFAGWATSIPAGGTEVANRIKIRKEVRRGIAGLPFTERRCTIDQGHKLVAAIDEIIATDGGAIAATWRHVREHLPAYDARPAHVALDGKLFVVRDNWALRDGLMKLAGHSYTDEAKEQPAQAPYCRCRWVFKYILRELPGEMLTQKGHAALNAAHAA